MKTSKIKYSLFALLLIGMFALPSCTDDEGNIDVGLTCLFFATLEAGQFDFDECTAIFSSDIGQFF